MGRADVRRHSTRSGRTPCATCAWARCCPFCVCLPPGQGRPPPSRRPAPTVSAGLAGPRLTASSWGHSAPMAASHAAPHGATPWHLLTWHPPEMATWPSRSARSTGSRSRSPTPGVLPGATSPTASYRRVCSSTRMTPRSPSVAWGMFASSAPTTGPLPPSRSRTGKAARCGGSSSAPGPPPSSRPPTSRPPGY